MVSREAHGRIEVRIELGVLASPVAASVSVRAFAAAEARYRIQLMF